MIEISQLLGNYGEFVGAVAVVLTLAYLSGQVRSNSRSTRSQTLIDSSIQYQNLLLAPANSAELRSAMGKNHGGEALSSAERLALASWYSAMMNFLYATWLQAEIGAFGKGGEYQGLKDATRQFLEDPALTSLLSSAESQSFHDGELKRHYSYLEDVAASISDREED